MPEQLLHGAQVAAGLQQVAGKRVAQHVRVYRHGQAGLAAAPAQPLPDRLGCQPRATAPDEKRQLLDGALLGAHSQPVLQGQQCLGANWHAAPLAALSQHMGLGCLQVNPAARLGAGIDVQPGQFTHPQAAAIEQLQHGRVSGHQPGCISAGIKVSQLHGLVNPQRLGQGFTSFGCAHVLHRVAGDLIGAPQPSVKTAPARQNKGDAARAASARMHLRGPAPDLGVLNLLERQISLGGMGPKFVQIDRVEAQCALGQAFFDPGVQQVTLAQGLGGSRVVGHGQACFSAGAGGRGPPHTVQPDAQETRCPWHC